MLEIFNKPELEKCAEDFKAGETLFLEGDDSTDMYVLVSGRLEIYKDDKLISDITEPGALVGEMSYLLGSRRTATVKAGTDVRVIIIASGKIAEFFADFPDLTPSIAQNLAQRLQETTRVVHGLKEFCDQLPDAVIMTDRNMNILTWNQAAETLYGRTRQQIKDLPLAEVFGSPAEYKEFVGDVRSGRSLAEKTVLVKHPEDEERYASTSTTILYDGHHNVEGFIFLSRDVSRVKQLEAKYRRIRNWMTPALIAGVALVIAVFFSMPYLSKGMRVLDQRKDSFRTRINEDSRTLSSSLSVLSDGAEPVVQEVLRRYFADNSARLNGINGLVLLDRDKKVLAAFSPVQLETVEAMIGYSYSGIKFRGEEEALYRHLTLFRADKENPMGRKGEEIAYDLRSVGGPAGWLVFQLDMERLDKDFGIDGDMLDEIDFQR